MALNNIGLGFVIRAKDMASAAFKSAGRAIDSLRGRATKFGGSVEDVSSFLDGTGKKLMLMGTAGLSGLGVAAHSAVTFGKSVAEVASIADKAEFPVDRIKQIGMDMAGTYGGDLNKQVKTLYQAISSGASTSAQATALMHESNKLAIGGLSDSFLAIDAMTNVLNAYGMDMSQAAQVSDAMFVTVNKGKTTIDELAGVIGRVAPTAAAMGVSMDDMFSAVTAASTRLGNASESVTGFKAALANIMAPTKDAADEAKRLGIQFDAAALRSKGLSKFMKDITSSGQYNADTMGKLFGSIEAFNFVSAIAANNGAALSDSMSAMSKKAGAADAAYKVLSQTAAATSERLKGKLEVAMVRLGEAVAPSVEKLAAVIEKMLDAWNNAPTFVHDATAAFIGLASVLAIVAGAILVVVGALVGAEAAGITAGVIGGAFAAVLPIVGYLAAALAGVAVVVAAIGYAYEANLGGLGDKVKATANSVSLAWTGLAELIESGRFSKATADELGKAENKSILEFIATTKGMLDTLGNGWDAFVKGFKDGMTELAPVAEAIARIMDESFKVVGQSLTLLASSFGGASEGAGTLQLVMDGLGAVAAFIGSSFALLVSSIAMAFGIIVPIVVGAIRAIVAIIVGFVDVLINVGGLIEAVINGQWGEAWNRLKQIVFDVVGAIIDGVAMMVEGVAGAIDSLVNSVKPGTSKLMENVGGIRKEMKQDFANLIGAKNESAAVKVAETTFGAKRQGSTAEDLKSLLTNVAPPAMPAPTPTTAPGQAAPAGGDFSALLAAIQQQQKGAPPVNVNLKSALILDGAVLAETLQSQQQAAGQRGLAPAPMPQ